MKISIPKTVFATSLIAAISLLSACSSTRSDNGITIEEKASYNPLNYIPGL